MQLSLVCTRTLERTRSRLRQCMMLMVSPEISGSMISLILSSLTDLILSNWISKFYSQLENMYCSFVVSHEDLFSISKGDGIGMAHVNEKFSVSVIFIVKVNRYQTF